MSREIKFKAWDRRKKLMLIPTAVTSFRISFNGEIWFEDELLDNDDLILRQYTGIKDKNDDEIYEGDILGIPIRCFNQGNVETTDVQKMIVECKIGDVSQTYGHGHHGEDKFSGFRLDGYYGGADKWEIIGNIHQNPELI